MSEPCFIEELLKNNFSKRSLEEKLSIIARGRPVPELPTLQSLALMSIEKDLLTNLTKEDAFYEAVIDAFAKKDRRIELIYK